MSKYVIINGELYHWGIKGMRWGIRRFQKKDGSLTSAGKKRYADAEETIAKTKDAISKAKKTIEVKAGIKLTSSKKNTLDDDDEKTETDNEEIEKNKSDDTQTSTTTKPRTAEGSMAESAMYDRYAKKWEESGDTILAEYARQKSAALKKEAQELAEKEVNTARAERFKKETLRDRMEREEREDAEWEARRKKEREKRKDEDILDRWERESKEDDERDARRKKDREEWDKLHGR